MPQLDHVSYFSQFFWISLLFLAFYLLLVQTFLPRIATILKVRKKLIIQGNTGNNNEVNPTKTEDVISSYDQVVLNSLKQAKELLSDANKQTNVWTSTSHQQFVDKNLKQSYSKYVQSIGDILSKKYLLQSLLK